MRPVLRLGLLLLPFLSLLPGRAMSQEGEEAIVLQMTNDLLRALSAGDTATLAELLAPEAMIQSVRDAAGGVEMGARTRTSFLSGLGEDDRDLLERMWDPTVMVQGRVAMVWTPYDFHVDGGFSHCGIDVFTFLKGEDGWKVSGITYDVVREGCSPSPLGPPGR